MSTKGLVAGLLFSSMVLLTPMKGDCVNHENDNGFTKQAHTVAMQRAQNQALTKSQPAEECQSYLQVYESIDTDPEHAQARAVTPSYDLR